jgi:hypothetical protein
MTLTVGFELEVSGNARSVLSHLQNAGLTTHTRLHDYHCCCEQCEPSTMPALFKAQLDCTADGEFITSILEYGSRDMDKAILGISRALILGKGCVGGSVGNHVHVSQEGMSGMAKRRLLRIFARYEGDLLEIAAAGHDCMRGYNGRMTVPDMLWDEVEGRPQRERRASSMSHGNTLAWKNPTVEFRLWNATRAAWRIRTHVGLSAAMVQAATARVDVTRDDPRTFEEVVGPHMDAATWAGLIRQRYSKGGFNATEVAA